MLLWYLYPPKVAMVVNIVLLVFLVVFTLNGVDIFQRLYVSEDDAVSGKFGNFANTYQ